MMLYTDIEIVFVAVLFLLWTFVVAYGFFLKGIREGVFQERTKQLNRDYPDSEFRDDRFTSNFRRGLIRETRRDERRAEPLWQYNEIKPRLPK
jgi:hypothetical protein